MVWRLNQRARRWAGAGTGGNSSASPCTPRTVPSAGSASIPYREGLTAGRSTTSSPSANDPTWRTNWTTCAPSTGGNSGARRAGTAATRSARPDQSTMPGGRFPYRYRVLPPRYGIPRPVPRAGRGYYFLGTRPAPLQVVHVRGRGRGSTWLIAFVVTVFLPLHVGHLFVASLRNRTMIPDPSFCQRVPAGTQHHHQSWWFGGDATCPTDQGPSSSSFPRRAFTHGPAADPAPQVLDTTAGLVHVGYAGVLLFPHSSSLCGSAGTMLLTGWL
jgi:hypothetical protein